MSPLNILITNAGLDGRSGTTLYVRDLALELVRVGHRPVIYTLSLGSIASELRAAGVMVTTRLGRVPRPDVIHGHHFHGTLHAVEWFRNVPAIYICHDHRSALDRTPRHPLVRRYFGVSRLCMDRLIREDVPPGVAEFLPNFVDTRRFLPRMPLPVEPRKALLFSNYASEKSHLPAVREACSRLGLELDVAGAAVDRSLTHPEKVIGQYDVVFAKAKAAMEAMAVGAAVVLCDATGVGPMVTAAEFDELRMLNFGFESLNHPLTPEHLLRQIARYDRQDAEKVRDKLRSQSDLESQVVALIRIYEDAIKETQAQDPRTPVYVDTASIPVFKLKCILLAARLWMSVPHSFRMTLKELHGLKLVHGIIKRNLH